MSMMCERGKRIICSVFEADIRSDHCVHPLGKVSTPGEIRQSDLAWDREDAD